LSILAKAEPDGTAPECWFCLQPIPVGSEAVANRYGATCFHPECHLPYMRNGGASGSRPARQDGAHSPAAAVASGARDIGDQVADELDRQLGRTPDLQDTVAERMATRRGKSLVTPEPERSASGRQNLDAYLAECEALGPRNPTTGLRPTQDLGDAIAERMAEQRKGYR